uniref:Stress response protein NST1 n=2 Tax=Noccaea caerulescens TaxID=107243 RepID=A0A1J3HH04_NOCCA
MMPGLAQRNDQYSFGFWSKEIDGVSYNQLQKFWSELSPKARQELLKIDKQTLFEQARKNMYCSRCNGLLLEGFLQIVMHGKSLHPEGSIGNSPSNKSGGSKYQNDCNSVVSNGCGDEMQDPSVHPWGGLTTTRDGSLTLLDCYLYAKSLKGLQNVFDSAPARERERELLYPDACGGGGRGWISQGMASYGRGHGTRETCALHTARLSCDTLVDFWSALSEETRQSLLRMKEEDFMERLRYRFDSKRFCRDCRRNVIREFKELKELKRMQREPRCTDWFCVADKAFQYKVNIDSVQADWSQNFTENAGYHQFEWAIGTGEGESDILDFKYLGGDRSARVSGLDLRGLHECYITLRTFKKNGSSSDISVKAHALRGQQCVHSKLVVGDGFVSIKRGECIRMFFEHAEEAEEEEDEDMMDKDGNDLDGECSRPQKHAKSPELAREFLLDAATVIFKEQVEKAFREGTARQNAHSIFVCLTLKLLEQRVHVACKEIITLEKQVKLLEEEEKEKREEEERKEKKRTKEREKKLRRKERLKEKEKGKEKKIPESGDIETLLISSREEEEELPNIDDEINNAINCEESEIETGDADLSPPGSPDVQKGQCLDGCPSPGIEDHYCDSPDREIIDLDDENEYFTNYHQRPVHQNARYWKEMQSDPSLRWSDKRRYSENASFTSRSEARYRNDRLEVPSRGFNGPNRQLRVKASKTGGVNGVKSHEKFQCSDNRTGERFDFNSCSCKPSSEYRAKVEPNISATRSMRDPKTLSNSDSAPDASKPVFRGNRYNQPDHTRELRLKSKVPNPSSTRDSPHSKQVWEPMEPKKYPRSNSDSEVTVRCSTFKPEEIEDTSIAKATEKLDITKLKDKNSMESGETKNGWHLKDPMMSSTSSSDNCSSCLSEGESNTVSSNNGNTESSSTSDSEDTSQQSEGRENIAVGTQNAILITDTTGKSKISETPIAVTGNITDNNSNNNMAHGVVNAQLQGGMFPQMLNHNLQFPVFQAASPMSYFHQAQPVSWPAAPANGLVPFPHHNPYLYTGPLGYSMNGDSPLCLQYGNPLNHAATPFFSPGPVPVFHPFAKANTEEQAQTLEPSMEVNGLAPPETQTVSEDSFSLFHFSGPVGLSTGNKSKPAHSKDGVLRDLAGNGDTKAKESREVEEYNLFATSNGLRFSLF